ncbi:MAG: DnaJ domain-containing protein [Lachnospiraceae bacterium]|nr:DnaJ domain-containing protein [Lachnospiraceae bacterium]
MIADPYKILGIGENCTDDELKKAYRAMSKKWHPDANPNNQAVAEEKFKEVQEAYRQIVDARARGTSAYGSSSGYGPGSSYGYNSSSAGRDYREYNGYGNMYEDFFNQWANYSNQRRQENANEPNEMVAARNYINAGHYREAMTALGQMAESARTARWYYYAAMASQGMGNNVGAMNYAKRAADMEPDNMEYRRLLQNLQNGGTWYQNRGETYGGFTQMSSGTSWCLSMLALNLFCNCCCGGRFFYL